MIETKEVTRNQRDTLIRWLKTYKSMDSQITSIKKTLIIRVDNSDPDLAYLTSLSKDVDRLEEVHEAIKSALEQTDETTRQIIELLYMKRKRQDYVSDVLHLSNSAMRKRRDSFLEELKLAIGMA